MKDTQESWSRGNNSGLNRGVRGNNGTRNVGWSGPTQISYSGNVRVIVKCKQSCAWFDESVVDFDAVSTYVILLSELGKAAYDGEKGSVASSFSSSITHAEGKIMNQQTLLHRLVL